MIKKRGREGDKEKEERGSGGGKVGGKERE